MSGIKNFEEIHSWQKARIFCQEIHAIIGSSQLKYDHKLSDQIVSASGSIMDNIAEGFGRGSNKEFIHFLQIAHASACECASQLYRILDKTYIDQLKFDQLMELIIEIRKLIIGLINYLKSSEVKGVRFLP